MSETRSIYFVRHGEKEAPVTHNSIKNRSLPLTRAGKKQAKVVGALLSSLDVGSVYSSDYRRALDTAKIANEQIKKVLHVDKRFGERVLLSRDTPSAISKREFVQSQRDWSYKPDGGESLLNVASRFTDAVNDLLSNTKMNVAVFTHGRAMQTYLGHVFNRAEFLVPELTIHSGDMYRVDYINGIPTHFEYIMFPLLDSVSGVTIPTTTNSRVTISPDTKRVSKTHVFDKAPGHNIQANIYENSSLDALKLAGARVPGHRRLLKLGQNIEMDHIAGDNLATIIARQKDARKQSHLVGVLLRKIHNNMSSGTFQPGFIVHSPDQNFNAQCALNFSELTVQSLARRSDHALYSSFRDHSKMAMEIIKTNPHYLDSTDIIYGDFKPDNIIFGTRGAYLIDPILSYGRVSCDLGKMISRFYLISPKTASSNTQALLDGYRPSARILQEIRHMAGLDILNTYSRLLAKNQLTPKKGIVSHRLTLKNLEYCINNVVPMLFGSTNVLILRHLDDVQDFREHYRNTAIVEGQEKEVPAIARLLLEKHYALNKKRICLITSPQIRATQTASLVVNEICNIQPDIGISTIIDERILDLYHGRYVIPATYRIGEKLPALSLSNKAYIDQTFVKHNLDYQNGDPLNDTYPELYGLFSEYGESQRSFSSRFYDFMDSFLRELSRDSDTLYVIVAHTAIAFRLFELNYMVDDASCAEVPLGELSFQEWKQAYKIDRNPGNQLFISHGDIKQLNVNNMLGYSWRFADEVRRLKRSRARF